MPSQEWPSGTRAGDFSLPVRDYGNDEIGAVARALDDSVREIGQRAADLESDRARMEAILGGMIEGVLVVNEQGRVQLVNTAARRMLRLQDGSEGRHYLEIVRQPDIAERLGATLRGDTTEGLELALPRESDRSIIARSAPILTPPAQSASAATRAVSQPARGAVLVLHDITELRKADRVRRDFVANVSHELRTPLTAVRGYVEALLDGGTETPDARRFLEIIGRHTLRMERLVRDLLRLARLDAGQEPLEHVRCSVESLFTGVETELTDALEGRGTGSRAPDRAGRRDRERRPGEAPRRASQPARERVELLADVGANRDECRTSRRPLPPVRQR